MVILYYTSIYIWYIVILYHMVFLYQVTITAFRSICQDSPPPPDIQDRVIQREDDTPETSLGADDWGLPHFFPGETRGKS